MQGETDMSNSKKEPKITRRERLCRMLDISPESLIGGYAIEIEGRSFVKIRGGGSILLYTPDEIRVALSRGEFISVCGSSLSCSTYNRGALGVEGIICSVSFGGEK